MSISSSAILVDLNMSLWTGRKLDKKVSEEVNVSKNTAVNAGSYSKNLMAGAQSLVSITKFVASTRLWHMGQTLPWSDSGTRLVTMANFMDYKTTLSMRENTFNNMVGKFIGEYPSLVNNAANMLGALFDVNEYPDVDSVRKKFKVAYTFSPIPEAGDFRIDANNDVVRELEEQYRASYQARVNDAMKDAWGRLHEILSHISERMCEDEGADGEPIKRKFRESMLQNAFDLCGLLTKLNVTNDGNLEQARQELEQAISGIDVKDLRENKGIRKEMKSKVDGILNKFNW